MLVSLIEIGCSDLLLCAAQLAKEFPDAEMIIVNLHPLMGFHYPFQTKCVQLTTPGIILI